MMVGFWVERGNVFLFKNLFLFQGKTPKRDIILNIIFNQVGFCGTSIIKRAPKAPGGKKIAFNWMAVGGLLITMSRRISHPSGYSETGHVGYGPLTGWHREWLPSSLSRIMFPHLRWQPNDCRVDAQVTWTISCPGRTREVTPRASRRDRDSH